MTFFTQVARTQCPPGDIILTTQGQIDSFAIHYPGCTNIVGNLKIKEQYQQPILNLNGLAPITTISQKLIIRSQSLPNLTGLHNLTSIGDELEIYSCDALQNLDELSNLTHIGNRLDISYCSSLLDINGLNNVSQLTHITIKSNPKLNECAITPICNALSSSGWATIKNNAIGCESEETVSSHCTTNCVAGQSFFTQSKIDDIPNTCGSTIGTVVISGDDILNLAGFSNIDSIKGDLIIKNCNSLANLQGLNNIKSISGDLIINNCDSILNLQGFNSLHRIGGNFFIQNCDTLFTLQGLNSLSFVAGNLIIGNETYYSPDLDYHEENPQLAQLSGLESLDSIGGDFFINAPALLSFTGLNSLKKVGGTIRIEGCDFVPNFQGFSSLEEADAILLSPVTTYQYQFYKPPKPNGNLQDFSGLDNLIHLNHLNIGSNPNLLSFNGLQNVTKLKSLKIILNNSLTNFEGLNNLTEISEDFILGDKIEISQMYGGYSSSAETNIQSFSGLENLKSIGNFRIVNSNALIDFSGLDNLETILGDFQLGSIRYHCGMFGTNVFSNDTLSSFKGLSSLSTIGGSFSIIAKNKIKNFNHLSALDSIYGGLLINSSDMESMSGVSSLAFIGGGITLGDDRSSFMDKFNDFSQLSFIDSIHGSLNIIDLDSITDLSGFNNLKYVQKNLIIAGNDKLDNLDALSNLEYIGEEFSLGYFSRYQTLCDTRWGTEYMGYPHPNPSLHSIDGLSNLKTIGSTFTFAGNDLIESLSPLTSLEHIGDNVQIGLRAGLGWNALTPSFLGNEKLKDISILENVTFSHNVFLEKNTQLTNLTGIGNRDSIQTLEIIFCDSLLDLNGLSGIKSIDRLFIGYNFSSLGNENIHSLDGFDNDVFIEEAYVYNNPKLTTCGYPWLCDAILREKASIGNNAEFCMSNDDLNCDDLVIFGKVYYDLNQNKAKDSNEPNIPFQKIYFDPPGQTILTNQNGNFFQYCDSGTTYMVKWIPDSLWQLSTDSAQFTLTYFPGTPANYYKEFGLFPAFPYHSEDISISSNNTRCNETVLFRFFCRNTGTYVESGKIELTYDASTTFVSSINSNIVVDTINHRLTWPYDSLYQFTEIERSAIFLMPDQNSAGNQLYFHIKAYGDSLGTEILLDEYTYTPTVLCSFDPNDKQVMPSGEKDEHYTLHDQKLTYTIRFQNTGNAEAIDITIRDTIDTNLDISTLRVVNSSFPVQTSVKGHAVEFYFKNINLPDSTHNEPESHGFVTYEIKPQPGLSDYTKIENTAYIIFDFNDAIATNTTQNTMVTMIPVGLDEIDRTAISIRPNPADDIIYISAKIQQAIDNVMIYNALGELVLAQKGNKVDVGHLPKGIYLVKVVLDGKIGVEKLIID